jgi:hypothetical protein
MMQLGLVTAGGFLLSLAALWLLTAGAAGTLLSGGFGAGMSLFPIVLAGVGAGLVVAGLCHQLGRQ